MTMVFYIPAIRGGYIWDDDSYVTNNLNLRTLDGLRRIWFEIGAVPQYYPLVHSSFWIEYHLWQLHPFGYHMVNVLLHALNAILLWLILQRLSITGAWLAAAIFALHPVHVESVAWITERKNVLSCFFYLSAILTYLRFCQLDFSSSSAPSLSAYHRSTSAIDRYHWGYYTLALVLYLCALLSKTITCTMPAAILLLLWWKRGRIGWRRILLLNPHFVFGFCLGLITVWMEQHYVGAQGEEWTLSFVERCLVSGRALWFYVGKLFWPHKLTFFYPRWQINPGIWWQYLFPLAAVAVLIALWLLRRKIGKAPLVAVFFFAGTLAPALGFFDIYPLRYSFVADHFQYLASIGLIVLCTAVITKLFLQRVPSYRNSGFAAFGVVILILGVLTWKQGYIYKDAEALWRDTILKNPSAWMAHNNLGEVLVKQGKLDEGIEHFKKCLAIEPGHAKAHNNLGNVYTMKGRLNEAIAEIEQALSINPYYAMAHNSLGNVYLKNNELDKAISEYKQAIAFKPDYAMAHNNIGLAYCNKGMLDEAIAEYKKALAINPNLEAVHYNLSVAYYYKGNYKLAIIHCDKAVELGCIVYPKFLELLKPYR